MANFFVTITVQFQIVYTPLAFQADIFGKQGFSFRHTFANRAEPQLSNCRKSGPDNVLRILIKS